ncbi:MAG: toll/interleukin-1 receptor domain-containing protein [Bifidobacteriaceae bacterium]|jgi:hypothetical protein|nr:toll/interleukin-1 receptor domain-containing protein [Bifidobacteriaceae bacterium]
MTDQPAASAGTRCDTVLRGFISWHHNDLEAMGWGKAPVELLKELVETHVREDSQISGYTGVDVYLDLKQNPGQKWTDQQDKAARDADIFFAVVSANYPYSSECRREILTFVEAQRPGAKGYLIPIIAGPPPRRPDSARDYFQEDNRTRPFLAEAIKKALEPAPGEPEESRDGPETGWTGLLDELRKLVDAADPVKCVIDEFTPLIMPPPGADWDVFWDAVKGRILAWHGECGLGAAQATWHTEIAESLSGLDLSRFQPWETNKRLQVLSVDSNGAVQVTSPADAQHKDAIPLVSSPSAKVLAAVSGQTIRIFTCGDQPGQWKSVTVPTATTRAAEARLLAVSDGTPPRVLFSQDHHLCLGAGTDPAAEPCVVKRQVQVRPHTQAVLTDVGDALIHEGHIYVAETPSGWDRPSAPVSAAVASDVICTSGGVLQAVVTATDDKCRSPVVIAFRITEQEARELSRKTLAFTPSDTSSPNQGVSARWLRGCDNRTLIVRCERPQQVVALEWDEENNRWR